MAEVYELFRLSLLVRPQISLLDPRDQSREEYLREVFSKAFKFHHFGAEFHFVPSNDTDTGEMVLGRIGRSVRAEENASPDQSFEDVLRDTWKASIIALDPRHHGDGQKLALQSDPKVGKPNALVGSLVDAINEAHPDGQYDIEAAAIIDASTFWEFAESNAGEITTLRFEFVTPNMFGGADSITEELRALRQNEKAQKVEIAISSKDGIETNTERVKESVDYAVQGCGTIRARTKRGRRYNSTRKIRTTRVDPLATEQEPRLVRAARWLTKILGNE